MHRKPKKPKRFYKSDEMHFAGAIMTANQKGLCEKCGKLGNEVHHIIHLIINNIDDPNSSLNQSNLKLLWRYCHNKECYRFGKFTCYGFDFEGNLIQIYKK